MLGSFNKNSADCQQIYHPYTTDPNPLYCSRQRQFGDWTGSDSTMVTIFVKQIISRSKCHVNNKQTYIRQNDKAGVKFNRSTMDNDPDGQSSILDNVVDYS